MPLINPPNEYSTKIFTPEVKEEISEIRYMEILSYLESGNRLQWKCPSCNLTNFGHNKYCANWKCKLDRPNNE